MQEIYNEKIQDLLIDTSKRPHGGLKVRQSKTMGIYVEGLSKHPVDNYASIERKMEEGNHNRTIASTQMNSSSSRAHTIITLEFKQFEMINGKKVQRFSVINLVDLAGSEKFAKTGATGTRFKEGCSINKSLTVLGKVISTLADKAMGKKKKVVVPYRESSLTRILQNALGGNSKTLMICAISPSSDNYDETLSTLRYADQAKKIKCHAVINESEADRKIRQLQNENNELKELLRKLQKGDFSQLQGRPSSEAQPDNSEILKEKEEKNRLMMKKIQDLEDMLRANELMMTEQEKSFEERLKEEKQREMAIGNEKDLTVAHLTNVNEDPLLSGKIYHNLTQKQVLRFGKKNKEIPGQDLDIVLRGIGIQDLHAIIERRQGQFFIKPGCEEAINFLMLNGDKVEEERELCNWDRIALGFNSIYIFKNPKQPEKPRGFMDEQEIDWERCQVEIQCHLDNMNIDANPLQGMKQQHKYIEIEQECQRLKEEYESKIKKMEEEHQQKLQNNSALNDTMMDAEMEQYEHIRQLYFESYEKQLQAEQQKKDTFEKEYIQNFKERDKKKLEDKLYKINPKVIELNLISQELNRNISFKLHINFCYIDVEDLTSLEEKKKMRTKIEVQNHELGYSYFWDIETFNLKYYLIRELLDQYYLNGEIPQLKPEEDPFYEKEEQQVLGEGFLKLMSLAYLVDNPNELVIVGDKGQVASLAVNLIPVDEDLQVLDEDHEIFDEFIDDPTELFGKKINFLVTIGKIELKNIDVSQFSVHFSLLLQDENGKLVT